MQHTLAILSGEEEYARLLMEYMIQSTTFPFQVIAFTNLSFLKDYQLRKRIDYLLFTDDVLPEEIQATAIEYCFCLSEHKQDMIYNVWPCIFRYQRTSDIITQFMNHIRLRNQIQSEPYNHSKAIIYGVYSLSGTAIQILTAISIAKQLKKDGKVLFICWNPWITGTHLRLQGGTSLSEAIYIMKQDSCNRIQKIGEQIMQADYMDYLIGVEHYSDLLELSEQEIASFLNLLRESFGYDSILIDIPLMHQSWRHIMNHCDCIYEVPSDDHITPLMLQEFHRQLNLQQEEIVSRIILYQGEERNIGDNETGIAKENLIKY